MVRIAGVVLLVGALLLTACGPGATATPSAVQPNMANPAAKYCLDQGYKWESRAEAGGEVGYCLFPDGTECDEWAFYRSQCGPGAKAAGMPNPASVHCTEQGGKQEIRSEAGGEVGYCLFSDGSECEEWAFFRGDCAPGE